MKAILRLFRSFSLRHLARRKLRFFLAGISIILAVALFVSMRITEESILRSFSGSVKALSGKADLQVTQGEGVESSALAVIEGVPGLRAAPVVQASTTAPDLGVRVLVFGIDFIRDAKLREYDFRETEGEFDPARLFLFPVLKKGVPASHRHAEPVGVVAPLLVKTYDFLELGGKILAVRVIFTRLRCVRH